MNVNTQVSLGQPHAQPANCAALASTAFMDFIRSNSGLLAELATSVALAHVVSGVATHGIGALRRNLAAKVAMARRYYRLTSTTAR